MLSHCNILSQSNDFSDQDQNTSLCYCQLNVPHISCQNEDINIFAAKFQYPKTYVNPNQGLKDSRSEIDIISDILSILSSRFKPHYKSLIDQLVGYDIGIPLVCKGFFRTEKDLLDLRKKFQESNNLSESTQNKLNEATKNMDKSIDDQSHPYYSLPKLLTEGAAHASSSMNKPDPNLSSSSKSKQNSKKVFSQLSVSHCPAEELSFSNIQCHNSQIHFITSTPELMDQDSNGKNIIYINFTSNCKSNRDLIYLTTTFSNVKSGKALNIPSVLDSGANFFSLSLQHYKKLGLCEKDLEEQNKYTLRTTSNEKSEQQAVLGTKMLNIDILDIHGNYHRINIKVAILKYFLDYALFDVGTCKALQFQLLHKYNVTELYFKFPYPCPSRQQIQILTTNYPNYQNCGYYTISHQTHINRTIESDSVDWDFYSPEKYILTGEELDQILWSSNKLVDEEDTEAKISSKGYKTPNTDHLTNYQKEVLQTILDQFESAFSSSKFSTGRFRDFKVPIEFQQNARAYSKPREIDPDKLPQATELINGLLQNNIIQKCKPNMDFSCNMMILPKCQIKYNSKGDRFIRKAFNIKNEVQSWRFILDLRLYNKVSVKVPAISLSTVEQINAKLHSAEYIISLDIQNFFFNLELEPEAADKSCFYFNGQYYKLLRCAQGYCGSNYYAHKAIQSTWSLDRLNRCKKIYNITDFDVESYITRFHNYSDDIIVFSFSETQHIYDILFTLWCAWDSGLMINLHKSFFFAKSFQFLNKEYCLKSKSLALNNQRVQAILAWPPPSCLALLSCQMSSLCYHSTHIIGFAMLSLPFMIQLRSRQFKWDLEHLQYWNNLRYMVSLCITLSLPNPDTVMLITSDSSYAAGASACLSWNPQVQEFDLCSTFSTLYSKALCRQWIQKKELNMLCYSMNKHKNYILQNKNKVVIGCDVLSLLYANSGKSTNTNLNSVGILLSNFPNVTYLQLSGASNHLSDIFSRINARKVSQGGLRHTKNLIFHNRETRILNGQFLSPDTVLNFIFDNLDNGPYEDFNPHRDTFEEYNSKLDLRSIEDIFRSDSCEKNWIFISDKKLSLIKKRHFLWNKLLNRDQPTMTQLEKLDVKYRLSDLQKAGIIFYSYIKPLEMISSTYNNVINTSHSKTKEDDISGCPALESNIEKIFWPDQSRVFIEHCIDILKAVDKTKSIKELQQQLASYHLLSLQQKYDLVIKTKSFLESELNIHIDNFAAFYYPVLCSLRPSSDVQLREGINCINVSLKEDLIFTGLKVINLSILVICRAPSLYFESQNVLKGVICSQPSSVKLQDHYFHTLYLYSPKQIKIKKTDIPFKILGFKHEFKVHKTMQPVIVDSSTSEQWMQQEVAYQLINYEVVPSTITNKYTQNTKLIN